MLPQYTLNNFPQLVQRKCATLQKNCMLHCNLKCLNLALPPPQSIPSFLPQKDFTDSANSLKDVFSEAGPAAPAAEPLQVILQVRVPGGQVPGREASVVGGRGRHGM